MALHQGFQCTIVNKARSQGGMFENVCDVFVSQSVINRDDCEFEETSCHVNNRPFSSVFGEDANHSQIFSFVIVSELAIDDSTAKLMSSIDRLLVGNVFDIISLFSFHNCA
jgi:hypothetical protein